MGMIERFGRIADTYMEERNPPLEADEDRRRVHVGHGFWPTEVLRDTIIFASIIMVASILLLAHTATAPFCSRSFAQAGFVFPD